MELEKLSKKNVDPLELGERLLITGETSEAEKVLRRATRMLKNDKRRLADAMISLGVAFYRNGKVKRSLKTFMESLRLCEQVGYKPGVARSYSGLGLAYSSLRKPLEEALKYHEKALEVAREAGTPGVEARVLSNMGITYLMNDKPEDALRIFREAMEKAKMDGERHVEAMAFTNMAGALRVMGWLSEEVDARKRAVMIFDELGNVRDAAVNRFEMAFALSQMNNFDEAAEIAEQARKGFLQVKDKNMVKATDELIRKLRIKERTCPSCGAMILVEGLEYCPLCDASLVEEKRRRMRLPSLKLTRKL
ncbi:MAG: tetratricopeptide repeat protein [Candidatus Freyarchaeota archaeon]|nr:tetratricopeptide repeat protein [Candidatus Jordarchaeia archaeon]